MAGEKLGPASRQELVAIDGKTLNHSGVHLVSAILVPSLRCAGMEAVADKTNEITALRDLVDRIDLDGRLVEMDALHTQDETVQKLLYQEEQHSQRDQTYPTWQSYQSDNRWIMIRQIIEAPT